MSQTGKPERQNRSDNDKDAATPDRGPQESNYGYESDHPSYKQRGAGDWSPRFGAHQETRRNDAQRPSQPEAGEAKPPGKDAAEDR